MMGERREGNEKAKDKVINGEEYKYTQKDDCDITIHLLTTISC